MASLRPALRGTSYPAPKDCNPDRYNDRRVGARGLQRQVERMPRGGSRVFIQIIQQIKGWDVRPEQISAIVPAAQVRCRVPQAS